MTKPEKLYKYEQFSTRSLIVRFPNGATRPIAGSGNAASCCADKVDLGTISASTACFARWAKKASMAIQYIQPGKPNQNAYIERFNRTYREELLDQYLFASLEDVHEATYWRMLEYNEERPHDSLGDRTPTEARQQVAGNSTFELSP